MKIPLFPREALHWPSLEPSGWRALTLSSLEMGAITGVLLRAFRALALTHGAGSDGRPGLGVLLLGLTLGAVLLCGMLTLHLANFPVRRWIWRVPAFLLAEVAAELATSAALIAAGREPLGTTGHAQWHDLAGLAARTLIWRGAALVSFALVLAGVVQAVRWAMTRRGPHHLHPAAHE